ncbi:hypothetical protein GCM10023329_00010 [Streptomyces sanyensis]|uniref:Uncharacterized protein n=1 Tax=Streptomyces sanyensis TaxID=568869 RepID=A0ABP8ZKR8_9ACTN
MLRSCGWSAAEATGRPKAGSGPQRGPDALLLAGRAERVPAGGERSEPPPLTRSVSGRGAQRPGSL